MPPRISSISDHIHWIMDRGTLIEIRGSSLLQSVDTILSIVPQNLPILVRRFLDLISFGVEARSASVMC